MKPNLLVTFKKVVLPTGLVVQTELALVQWAGYGVAGLGTLSPAINTTLKRRPSEYFRPL